jgi:hypothetical protein
MVLAMLRCSVVGKWTGGAVGAETGKLIGGYKVSGAIPAPKLNYINFLYQAGRFAGTWCI